MLNVKTNRTTTLNLLCERVNYWRKANSKTAKLFYQMYENYLDNGCFDSADFDVMQIVDNDIINYCSIVKKGEKDFKKLLNLYKKGKYDVSCEDFEEHKASYIEAVSDNEDLILIRY